jgi:DNA topoisomerase-3
MENAGKQIEDEDIAAALSEKGIGTPATRADVIENLIAKGYAVRIDRALRPTVKGIRLVDTLRKVKIDRLTSPQLTGEIESHLQEVEKGERTDVDFMSEITDYACQIVDVAKTFGYDELYDDKVTFGACPSCGRDVIEMAWFYRCREQEGVSREDDCPLRFWKDTSGRYLDPRSVRAIIADGKTGTLDGFTARNGRTYKGFIELDKEEWSLKVRSLGYNEGEGVSDQVEYDVNPEPLGRCPFEEECSVVESPTQFVCERKLKEEELAKATDAEAEGDSERPKSCGFVLPRTVCKREITRDESLVYLQTGKTELLEDFTSRFGRPFSATLVLKSKSGRHGFEFPPRAPKGGKADGDAKGGKKTTTKKKKKATRKKTTRKKSAAKKTVVKKTAAKKTTRKKASRKKRAKKSAGKAPVAGPNSTTASDPVSEG